MSDSLPNQEAIDEVIQDAREAVITTITLIDDEECSPTMVRDMLLGILGRLDEIVTEADYLKNTVGRTTGMARRFRDQRDEVLQQRDSLARFIRDLYPEADDEPDSPDEDD